MAKKLLNEATIRRFQSLANISPINEMSYKEDKEEEKMEEGMYEAEEDGKEKMEETYTEQDADQADAEAPADMPDMDDMGEEMDIDLTEEEAQF